jgi:hypothetical protein
MEPRRESHRWPNTDSVGARVHPENPLLSNVGALQAHKKQMGSPKAAHNSLILLVARDGIEPPTHGFSARAGDI